MPTVSELSAEIAQIRKEHAEDRLKMQSEISNLRREAMERERSRLKAGLSVVGAVVVALGGYIWAQVGPIFDFGDPR